MKKYESPVFTVSSGDQFAQELWAKFTGDKWCFGCTNCSCN